MPRVQTQFLEFIFLESMLTIRDNNEVLAGNDEADCRGDQLDQQPGLQVSQSVQVELTYRQQRDSTCCIIDRKQRRPRDESEYGVRPPDFLHAGVQMSALGSVPISL